MYAYIQDLWPSAPTLISLNRIMFQEIILHLDQEK